jgi:AmiR/NasT family two-component response regulator
VQPPGELESQVVIEQARGIAAQHNTVPVDRAYQLMRWYARNNNVSLCSVAEVIAALGSQI